MSDQSPWGTPPPNNNPYGSPAQPTPPPTPPYGQPAAGGGWGAGGGSPYGGSPYGQPPQPPRKSRTGLIVGIVAAVVLVVAAFVVTLVVAGGDDDPDEAGSSSTETSTETTDTDEPTETDTTTSEPTETETTETDSPETDDPGPSGEGTITGDGYTYELPAAGWTDQTDEAGALGGPTLDTVIVLGRSIDLAQSNILVEALSASGASSVEDIEGLWKRNLSGSDGATPVDIDGITIDGEQAVGVRIDDRVNNAGVEITQVAYLVLHDGSQYSIALTFPSSGDSVSEDDFGTLLDSWTWTS